MRLWTLGTAQARLKWKKSWWGGEAWVRALAFSPDGMVLAAAGDDKIIRLHEAATGRVLGRLEVQGIAVDTLAFSPDGRTLAAGGRDNKIYLWDAATRRQLPCLGTGERQRSGWGLGGLAFSPCGKMLASGGCPISVWEARTGKRLLQLEASANSVAFSPDGKMLAGGGAYSPMESPFGLGGGWPLPIVYVWEVASGKERRQLKWDPLPPRPGSLIGGSWGAVTAIAFSPDGKSLASGGPDQARIWELATGHQNRLLEGHDGNFFTVAFSPDGRTLATSSGDGKVRIWDASTQPGGQVSANLKPSINELQTQWEDLASQDAAKAYHAICTLVQWPKEAVPFLEERLQRILRADPQRIPQLITELDSNQFELRRKAMDELEQLGELAEPALQELLTGKPSPEVRQRAEGLLRMLEERGLPAERLRVLRSIEVLEHIGTPEVLPILQSLARGRTEDRLTQEAKAALERLAKQPPAHGCGG